MDRDSRYLLGGGAARWLAAIPAVFLTLFFLYPMVRVLWRSLTLDGSLHLGAFTEIVIKGSLRQAAWFTIWQALVSTLATLVFALPGAYVLARFRFPGRGLIRAAITVPFVLPTVVVGTAYLVLLGPNGPLGIDLRQTAWAILIAHVFFNYAVVVRVVGSFWELIDPKLEDAARVLGATGFQAFRTVTLPLLLPAISAAASIVFLFTFTSFGVVLILGGFGYATIEVAVWREATINLDLATSAALAVFQLVVVSLALSAYTRLQHRYARHLPLRPSAEVARRPSTIGQLLVIGGTLISMAVYLGIPIITLVARSLNTSSGIGLTHFLGLFGGETSVVSPSEAIFNSIWFASVSALPALVVGMAAALFLTRPSGRVGSGFDTLLMLPLGTSAVTIGFGFLVAFGWPVDLRTSAWLIPLAHTVVAVPFVIRTVTPVLRSAQPRLMEAAAVLGASPRQVFQEIQLPIVSRAALVGAGFALAVSLGEFGATAFLVRPDRPTIPTAIFRLLGQPGATNLGQAMALSVILMVIITLVILAVDSHRIRGPGEI